MSEKIVGAIVGAFGGLASIAYGKEILVFIIFGVIYITIISGSYDPITNLYNQEKFEKIIRFILR